MSITTYLPEDLSMVDLFENFIPEDATCISVKINIPDYDASDSNFIPPCFPSILRYLKDSGVELLAYSSGIHTEGRKQIPHIHYHFIANHYNEPSNASQHRKRWLGKKGNETDTFEDATFKYQRLEGNKPRFQFLSYPLKEGQTLSSKHYMFDNKPMTKEMKIFLLYIGKTLYAQQTALRLRQDKCQERKQLALKELYEICSQQSFSSFKEMMIWLDVNYIDTLELDDMPDPKNYKTNCQKIAVKLKLLKYSDI